MRNLSFFLAPGLFAAAIAAQSVTLPQQAIGLEGPSTTAYPWNPCLNTSCSIRVQYFYTANAFAPQGVSGPVTITQLTWRGDGNVAHAGGITFPNVQVELSTATPGAILAPNPVFASNHGADRAIVFPSGPVTTIASTGSSPNSPIVSIPITPFLYDPNLGDLCVDITNQAPIGTPGVAVDQFTTLASDGARVWDFSPGATQMFPASGNNQPGIGIVMDVAYSPAAGYAAASRYGVGCYNRPGSFYEFFTAAGGFDLANTGLTMIFNGTDGYVVLPAITTYVPPSPTALNLNLGDDSRTNVPLTTPLSFPGGSTTSLEVCSNGHVSTGFGNGTNYVPTVGEFLNFSQTVWAASWHDYNPAVGGAVKFEEVGNVAYVTYENVADFGVGASQSTFQLQFDRSTGVVTILWQSMSLTGNGHLVGFKLGGPVIDPGGRDISSTLVGTFAAGRDLVPLTLNSSARPRLGTTINLVSTNCPANSLLGVTMLSFTQFNPGLPMPFPGMTGCELFAGLDSSSMFIPAGGTGSIALAIPANPAFSGVTVFSQSGVVAPGVNAFGALSSNGLRLLVNPN